MRKLAEAKLTRKEKFLATAQEQEGSEKAFNAALKRIGSAKFVAGKPKTKSSKKRRG
jgi:hypothetical protein